MKRTIQLILIGFVLNVGAAWSAETITESSTGKQFPKQVTFSHGGTDYTLTATGAAVRKKMIFKVYGIAHYLQDAQKGAAADLFKAALTDGKAKQITMDFVRGVEAGKIQTAYREGFEKNSTAEELKQIQPQIEQFIGYFNGADVKENDQYMLRWLPGGIVVAVVKGQEKAPITNAVFARVLWSIWLGDNSIVDRDKLVDQLITK